jgi:hypothetical protein
VHDTRVPSPRRRLARFALSLALTSSLALAAAPSSAQSDQEKAAARELAMQGAAALAGKQYAQALDLVTRAQALFNAPTHLLMIAEAQAGLGHYVAAQEAYLKVIRADLPPNAAPAFKKAQVTAKDELPAVEAKIAQLRIVLDGIGTRSPTVKMDDQPVPAALLGVYQPVDPGKHQISVVVDQQPPVTGAVELHEAEKKDIHLTIPDTPATPAGGAGAAGGAAAGGGTTPDTGGGGFMTPLRGAGIGVGAAGVVGVVVGSIFLTKGFSTQSQADSLAMMLCTSGGTKCPTSAKPKIDPLDQSAAQQKTGGVVGLGIGGAALVAGVVLLAIGKPRPAQAPAAATVAPFFSGDAAGVRGTF